MRQIALLAILLGLAVSEKIPLHKKSLKLQNFKREKALRASSSNKFLDKYL
jgi:hypothetical protein